MLLLLLLLLLFSFSPLPHWARGAFFLQCLNFDKINNHLGSLLTTSVYQPDDIGLLGQNLLVPFFILSAHLFCVSHVGRFLFSRSHLYKLGLAHSHLLLRTQTPRGHPRCWSVPVFSCPVGFSLTTHSRDWGWCLQCTSSPGGDKLSENPNCT